MKLRYLVLLAVPAILGACSSIDTQCKDGTCATVYRNAGGMGDMFYTSVVTKDEKIVAVVGGSQPSPVGGILGAGIIGGSVIYGGRAVGRGLAGAIPAFPMPPMAP